MKKIKYFLGIFLIVLLTGCVKYNTEMTINSDNSVDFSMVYSVETQDLDNIEFTPSDDEGVTLVESETSSSSSSETNIEDFEFLKKYGFTIEEIDEKVNNKNISGVILYKKFKSLQNMVFNEKTVLDFTKIFQEESDFFKYDKFFYMENDKYAANYIFDFRADEDDGTKNEDVDYSAYSSMFDLKYTISFPESVTNIESNATEISDDGHKLTWNLELGKRNSVEFSFVTDKTVNEIDKIIILSCLGTIGVSFLLIVIVLLTKINDRKKIEIDEDMENFDEEQ